MTSVMSMAAIIGPLLMNNLFYYFTHANAPVYLPGAPFMLGSFLMLCSCLLAYRTLYHKKQPVS